MKRQLAVPVFLIVLLSSGLVFADEAEKGRTAGREAGNKMRLELDSTDEINKKVVQPLTSEATSMRTFGSENEQQAFNAQLIAPSSDLFLKIVIHPSPSQDLGLTVNQDTDFDGQTDHICNLPVKISGVCANGIISCGTGTWGNCAYYKWKADDNMAVSIQQQDSIEDLATCYCINTSCDSHLVNDNPGVILKDLGTGITAAIQAGNPRCVITDVLVEADSISYYGLETSGISNNNDVYFSGITNPQQYYKNGNLPVEQEITRQKDDPDSFYNLLKKAADDQPPVDIIECTITNDITVIEKEQTIDVELTVWYDSTPKAETDRVKVTAISPVGHFYGWSAGLDNHFNDLGFEILKRAGLKITSIEKQDLAKFNEMAQFWWDNFPKIHGPYEVTLTCDTIVSTIEAQSQNNCHPDPECRLKEEKVCDAQRLNCVDTWQNYNPNKVIPLPMCKVFSAVEYDVLVNYTACMDGTNVTLLKEGNANAQLLKSADDMWWHIKRVYSCEGKGKYDFSNALTRTRHIRDTEKDNLDSLHFEDYDPETNKTTAYDINLPDRPDYETCEKACKLKKPVEDTKAGTPGTTAQYRNTIKSYVYVYKKCENSICPVSDDEQIVKDCGCLDDFAEAASIMQVLNNAAKDAECGEYDDQGNCLNLTHIFNGKDQRCRSDGITIGDDNCCKDDEIWFGLGECKEQEKDLATSKKKGLCHYIDKYCSKKLNLGFDKVCIEHSKTYCCFNSKLARIIHEQGRPQLKGEISNWGSAKNPNCQGFTIEEFQMLDFSRIDLSEWYEDIETKTQDQIENEMEGSVQSFHEQFN